MPDKVSYVIPSHNAAAWLPLAVRSVQDQDYPDIELIIVNDGSTDTTMEYLTWLHEQMGDKVKILVNTRAKGRSSARNWGVQAAAGDYIFVLDADDIAMPNRTKDTVKKFRSGADFVYGVAGLIDALGHPRVNADGQEVIGMRTFNREDMWRRMEEWAQAYPFASVEDEIKSGMARYHETGIVHSSVAYRKSLIQANPYRGGCICRLGIDDWAMIMDVAASGAKMAHVERGLCKYRLLATSVSQTRDRKETLMAKKRVFSAMKVSA